MKRSFFVFAIITISIITGWTVRPAKGASDGITRYYAIICGVSDYIYSDNINIFDLAYCDDDARDIRSALLASTNWSSSNITLLVNRAATKSAIKSAIQRMARISDEDDVCLFFFSGHGTYSDDVPPYDESDGYDEYICPTNSNPHGYNNDIRDDEFSEWIAALPTSNYIIMLDTCYSGGMIKSMGPGKAKVIGKALSKKRDGFAAHIARAIKAKSQSIQAKDLQDNGRGIVLAASQPDGDSYDEPDLQNGMFAYYLIDGMTEVADTDYDKWVSAQECYNYARPLTISHAANCDPPLTMDPELYDATSGELNFISFNPVVSKCTVTAGKNNSDKICFSGKIAPDTADFSSGNVEVTIYSDHMAPQVLTFPINGDTFKNNKYSYSGIDGLIKKSFKYDTATRNFTFSAANINLTGLDCQLTAAFQIGSYSGTAVVDETIANGKKPMPIILLMGIENSLRVDKVQTRRSTTTNKSQLTVKGGFATAADVDMASVPFSITLDSQTFTIPTSSFKAGKGKFTCSKVNVTEGGIATGIAAAAFDFNKGTFTLTIKNIDIAAGPGTAANLTMDFGSFSGDAVVTLP